MIRLQWPCLVFPPINLYSAPKNDLYHIDTIPTINQSLLEAPSYREARKRLLERRSIKIQIYNQRANR